ncbi:flagellar biosynthesis protein FliT, partial [Escherichia coli]|nr:flagellar biosynthesis protein FliT [Escherichia coli]
MSNAPQLYTLYQQLLEQSQLMLRLARQGLWDDLITCETDYVNAVHSLARLT